MGSHYNLFVVTHPDEGPGVEEGRVPFAFPPRVGEIVRLRDRRYVVIEIFHKYDHGDQSPMTVVHLGDDND